MHIKQNRHFIVLDGWRGISACFVALLHFGANNHIYQIPLVSSAGFFVDFFFVLSGFVILANYEQKLKQGYGFIKFMLLRFGRLYPLHFVTLLAFISVEILQNAIPALTQYAQTQPFSLPGEQFWDIISNLFLFQALDWERAKGFNAPSWSISAEFYTYIVFAAGVIIFKKNVLAFCASISVLSLLVLISADITDHKIMIVSGFLRCLVGFSFGAICWFIWKKYQDAIEHKNVSRTYWNMIEIIAVIAVYLFIDYAKGPVIQNLAAIVCSITLLIFSFEKGVISNCLKRPFIQLLGLLSYSIYMVHVFIAAKIFPIVSKLIESRFDIDLFVTIDGREKIGIEKWHGDIITLIYMVIVIMASYVTYKIIEDPGRKLSRHLVKKML